MPNSQDRLNKIRAALNSDIYSKIEEIEVESQTTGEESTTRLANILDGYNTRMSNNKDIEHSSDDLQLLDQMEVEIEVDENEILKAYNDNIHNSPSTNEETLSELAEQLIGTSEVSNQSSIGDLDIFDNVEAFTDESIEESDNTNIDKEIKLAEDDSTEVEEYDVKEVGEKLEVDDEMLIIQQEIEKLESMLVNNDEQVDTQEQIIVEDKHEIEQPITESVVSQEKQVFEELSEKGIEDAQKTTVVESAGEDEKSKVESVVEEEKPKVESPKKENTVSVESKKEAEQMAMLQAEIQRLEKQLQSNKLENEPEVKHVKQETESNMETSIKSNDEGKIVNESSIKINPERKKDNAVSKSKGSGHIVNIILILIIIVLLIAAVYYAYIGGYLQMIMELFR